MFTQLHLPPPRRDYGGSVATLCNAIIQKVERNYKHTKYLTTYAKELRQRQTLGEVKLWARLRRKQLNGLKFRRQFPFLNFILDFYCDELKLAIEIDGSSHDEFKYDYDVYRQRKIEKEGIRVIRFMETVVVNNIDNVMETLFREILK